MPKVAQIIVATIFVLVLTCNYAHGDSSKEQALRLFGRIAGARAAEDDPRIAEMTQKLELGDRAGAADIPTQDKSFYNVTVYQFFSSKSVRSRSHDNTLNDFIAMGIANTMIKNNGADRPYTEMVQGDFTVRIAGATPAEPEPDNNNHYQDAFNKRIVLSPATVQIRTPQRAGFTDAAGAITSRQFMFEHADMGTNRRIVEFTFENFLCKPIKEWRDGDAFFSDDLVTRDVDRRPGGDAAKYQNDCRSCHQMQDPLRKAFAFWDFLNNEVVYTPGTVAVKINKNPEVFPGGYVVTDNFFENRLTRNNNATYFGWRGSLMGNGAKQFGQMIARSRRFSLCAVDQVWEQICRRKTTESDRAATEWLADYFETNNYSLKELYKQVAITSSCMGVGN